MKGFILAVTSIFFFAATHSASGKIVYVSLDAAGDGSGSSWENAYRSISAGLIASVTGDEIWVASGRYMENIEMKPGVALYGGFLGKEGSSNSTP